MASGFLASLTSRCNVGTHLFFLHKKAANLFHVRATGVRKQLTFRDAITGFPQLSSMRNDHSNSILMTSHYPALGSASDWMK